MGFKLPRYTSPTFQVFLVGAVCFATVGMYSAIGNLGAGGTQDIILSDITNSVLYVMFALTGIVSGSVCNVLGPRMTLFFGTIGYALYVTGLWVFQEKGVRAYLIVTGGILGFCAALLWSAQGAVMMSYPLEKDKGRMFSLFWVVFNAGSLMGGFIALGINLNAGGLSAVKTSTYIAFFVVICVGVCLSWTLLPPGKVIRGDGTLVKLESFSSPREEVRNLWKTIKNKNILLLLPMFFASNYFYSYQGVFAFALFDAPTRAVNGVVKASAQIIGAIIIGFILDKTPMRRRNRGLAGLAVTVLIVVVAYGWGLSYQLKFNRLTIPNPKFHYSDGTFGEPIAILVLYDIGDAFYQGLAYWIMGAITNSPFELARFAGLYKAVQSAGSAVSFGVDAVKTPYLNELLSSWCMLLFSFPLAAYVIWNIADTNYDHEEVVYANGRDSEAVGEKDTDSKDGTLATVMEAK